MKYSCRNALLIISNTFTLSNSQVFIHKFDEGMARKLAIRSLRRGIGSMDYTHSLLIAEDDFDENTGGSDQQKSGQVGKQQEGLAERGSGEGSQASQPRGTTSTVKVKFLFGVYA